MAGGQPGRSRWMIRLETRDALARPLNLRVKIFLGFMGHMALCALEVEAELSSGPRKGG